MQEKEKLAKDKEYSITSVQFFMEYLYITFSHFGTKYELVVSLNTKSRIYEYVDPFPLGNKLVWVDDYLFDCCIWAEDVIEKFINDLKNCNGSIKSSRFKSRIED